VTKTIHKNIQIAGESAAAEEMLNFSLPVLPPILPPSCSVWHLPFTEFGESKSGNRRRNKDKDKNKNKNTQLTRNSVHDSKRISNSKRQRTRLNETPPSNQIYQIHSQRRETSDRSEDWQGRRSNSMVQLQFPSSRKRWEGEEK
jgi:hypothetical protein